MQNRKRIGVLAAAALAACVYVPVSTSTYDENCKMQQRKLVLEQAQLGGFGHCTNDGCVALLVGLGAVAAASAVVSGSVVVAGNIVYWVERGGKCAP